MVTRLGKEKWFDPQKHRGWSKSQSASYRRSLLMKSTDKRKSLHDRRLEAAHAMQALANVTEDRATRVKAKSDANYFYRLLKKRERR